MKDFGLEEMLAMQRSLQEKYKGRWEPIGVATGQNKLLWMIGEVGEVIDVVKKHGAEAAVSDPELRTQLVEEMADVLMYYNDVLLCYGITPEELGESYRKKYERNLTRWKP